MDQDKRHDDVDEGQQPEGAEPGYEPPRAEQIAEEGRTSTAAWISTGDPDSN